MKTKTEPHKGIDSVLKELGELYDFNREIQKFRFLEKETKWISIGYSGELPLQKLAVKKIL